jgi:hypothetical protein
MMKSLFVATVMASLLATSTAFAFGSMFEPMNAVQGKIQSVSPDGKTVMLVNGPTFTASPSLSTEPLKVGDEITVAYRDRSGHKEMTAFWIDGQDIRTS